MITAARANSHLLKCHNPLHILTSIWSLRVEGPSEGDGIDLSRDSGSINKQQASGFKAEETHLYFSWRVCIWTPELGRGPGQIVELASFIHLDLSR